VIDRVRHRNDLLKVNGLAIHFEIRFDNLSNVLATCARQEVGAMVRHG
jgi:hypothetical protein